MSQWSRFVTAGCLLLSATLGGCGGDDGVSPEEQIVGTYRLEQYGGQDLPALIAEGNAQMGLLRTERVAGTLQMQADKTWVAVFENRHTDLRTGQSTTEMRENRGVYELRGSTLFIQQVGSTPYEGTFDGTVLIFLRGPRSELRWRKVS